ncbi:hypothetical protein D0T49_00290 [Paludibacter sp. 221]|uniref:hypothetical protein n=1 Tax=Paludibacter sp. 221 TaxID=2302939 RepID=UPI0013D0FB72|nr:hypothetical protein [Paludibacter sp. 221]NDV45491.1 hypothetical protein [Paludibacter sp. 221]
MKKIILLITVCVSFCINAQNRDYHNLASNSVLNKLSNTDYKTVNELSDSLFSVLSKSYIRENYSNRANHYIVAFYPDEFERGSDVPFVSFSFFKPTIGANKDLGIVGKRVFRINEIEGTFLDLYVFWELFCKDLGVTPESKEIIVNKLPKKSEELFWLNSDNTDCSIQFYNKNYGDSPKWVIAYKEYVK